MALRVAWRKRRRVGNMFPILTMLRTAKIAPRAFRPDLLRAEIDWTGWTGTGGPSGAKLGFDHLEASLERILVRMFRFILVPC